MSHFLILMELNDEIELAFLFSIYELKENEIPFSLKDDRSTNF